MTNSARPPRTPAQPQPTQSNVPPVTNFDNSPVAMPQGAPPPITATRMPDPDAQLAPKPPPAPIDDNVRLALRLVIGAITEGGDMTLRTLRELQKEIDEHPESLLSAHGDTPDDRGDVLRYLAIGALLATQQRTAQGIESGLRLSARTTGWVFGTLDRATDNALLRPFRKPVDQLWLNMNQTMEEWVRQGRIEEANGRLLFDGTVGDVIDSLIENVSQAEELAQLVSDQIAQQSGSVASAAVNTGRTATVAADGVMEGLIRRLFRRPPREQLPPSPIAGKAQTMYETAERVGLEQIGLE